MISHCLEFAGLDYQNDDYNLATIWFDIRRGLFEPMAVRGTNVVLPSAEGQVWMPKKNDRRIIELIGFVRGVGVDLEDRQESWRTATDALMATLQFDASPAPLVVFPPYLGLADAKNIDAVAINTIGGPIIGSMTFQSWSVELEALGDWAVGSS